MSTFTRAKLFMPVVSGPRSGNWLSGQAFKFFESEDLTGPSIDIAVRDESNGADIPPAWSVFLTVAAALNPVLSIHDAVVSGLLVAALVAWLFPKVHAEYIAAVFIHDVGLKQFRHLFSRRRIDKMFLKAMRLERWALAPWPSKTRTTNLKAKTIWMLRDLPHWTWRTIRPFIIFGGVSIWGVLKERTKYFKPVLAKGNNHA